jgi:hypothetical protein
MIIIWCDLPCQCGADAVGHGRGVVGDLGRDIGQGLGG